MSSSTTHFLLLWEEARTRFSNQMLHLNASDLQKRMPAAPNSIGFLIRHIGDVELLFAKNIFGEKDIHVTAKTVIDKSDTGIWTDLDDLKAYVELSYEKLKSIIEKQSESDWETSVETKEFGRKTKAEALGRIISHTAYHAGQMALILKYGAS